MLSRFLKIPQRPSSDTVRLFLSSTFRDMFAERDHLVTSVYPELEERLSELDLAFFDVDLRWGVPRPEAAQIEEPLNSWAYCRRSIDEAEPFFVGVLGHRYGSLASEEHLTENERRRWGESRSITELEIRYAALDDSPPKRTSSFYFRSEPPGDMPADVRAEFFDSLTQKPLSALKQAIQQRYPVRNYDCAWGPSGPADLEHFGQLVLEDLWSATLRDERYAPLSLWRRVEPRVTARRRLLNGSEPIPRGTWQRFIEEARRSRSPLEVEERELARFRRERTRWFHGRKKEIRTLIDFALGRGSFSRTGQVLVAHGPPGRGKTALMCTLVERLMKEPTTEVISCFIGAVSRLSDEAGLLRRLIDLLEPNSISDRASVDQLRGRFAAAMLRRRRPLVFVVDGLDQLYSGADIAWLPRILPDTVRIVLSCANFAHATDVTPPPVDPFKVLTERLPASAFLEVPVLDRADMKEIAVLFFDDHGKSLEPAQLDAILALKQAADPLYLMVLLRELRALSGSRLYERVSGAIATSAKAPNATALFQQVMERLEVFGAPAVAAWMSALSLSRDGLSPAVLAEILAAKLGETGRLLAHRIRRAMQSYLQTRNGRSAFFHRALFDAARNRYALTDESARGGHAAIASALSLAWITKRDTYAMAERLHHLVEAQDWDGVLELLRDHAGLAEVLNEPDGARRFALDVDFAYERAPPDVAALIVSAFLALLLSQPARQARFDLNNVNAWLIYRPKAAFLRAALEAGARPEQDLLALSPEERELVVSSRIRLGGLLRREGNLVQAEAMLLGVLAAAGLRSATPPRAIGRLAVRLRGLLRRADKRASLIAYELGYIAFLRGELALARRWFRHAYAFGLAARDSTGAWISLCLAENCTFVARACRQLSHMTTQTSRTPARNVLASLSKRVAMAR